MEQVGWRDSDRVTKNAHVQAFFWSRCPRKKAPRKGAMVPVVGLEPTRMISPTDFESVTSANSITPANLLRFSAFFRFLEIGGHGGGQKSNFSIFDCQKNPKSGDFRSSERQTEKDFLSPARLPIPSFRRKWYCITGRGDWQGFSLGAGGFLPGEDGRSPVDRKDGE